MTGARITKPPLLLLDNSARYSVRADLTDVPDALWATLYGRAVARQLTGETDVHVEATPAGIAVELGMPEQAPAAVKALIDGVGPADEAWEAAIARHDEIELEVNAWWVEHQHEQLHYRRS